jgi:hypothetical protein
MHCSKPATVVSLGSHGGSSGHCAIPSHKVMVISQTAAGFGGCKVTEGPRGLHRRQQLQRQHLQGT